MYTLRMMSRETVLMLDTEMNQQLVLELITEEDIDKYFVQPNEQENKDETKTISSTSTADYNREEVEVSLQAIADVLIKSEMSMSTCAQ